MERSSFAPPAPRTHAREQAEGDRAHRGAEALFFLKEKFGNKKWTRKDIAEWAGTTPETVMRTLSDFQSNKIIEQVGRDIHIRDRRSLLKAANLNY